MKTGRDIAVKIMEIEKNELEPLKTEIAILKECSCENIGIEYYILKMLKYQFIFFCI